MRARFRQVVSLILLVLFGADVFGPTTKTEAPEVMKQPDEPVRMLDYGDLDISSSRYTTSASLATASSSPSVIGVAKVRRQEQSGQ